MLDWRWDGAFTPPSFGSKKYVVRSFIMKGGQTDLQTKNDLRKRSHLGRDGRTGIPAYLKYCPPVLLRIPEYLKCCLPEIPSITQYVKY